MLKHIKKKKEYKLFCNMNNKNCFAVIQIKKNIGNELS